MYDFKVFEQGIVYPRNIDMASDDQSCPRARSGHRMVRYGCYLYVFGGYNPSILEEDYNDEAWHSHSPLFKELWRFNLYSKKWFRLETQDEMPNELASHSVVMYGHYMLTYGGTACPFGESSSNLVHLCNLQSNKWQLMHTSGSKPKPMYGQAICRHGDVLYVVGGTEGFEYNIDVHSLDLKTMCWSNLTPRYNTVTDVEMRYRHEIIVHNGYLFVFGGGTKDENFELCTLPTFNLKTRVWHLTETNRDLSGFPSSRKCHQILNYKKFVFLHGGTDDDAQFGDLWRLDLDSMQWKRLMKSSHRRKTYFHSSAITEDGCIYLFGGLKSGSINRTNEVSRIWIDIPPLQSIAWEALIHYAPELTWSSSAYLLELGIPAYIVKALHSKFNKR